MDSLFFVRELHVDCNNGNANAHLQGGNVDGWGCCWRCISLLTENECWREHLPYDFGHFPAAKLVNTFTQSGGSIVNLEVWYDRCHFTAENYLPTTTTMAAAETAASTATEQQKKKQTRGQWNSTHIWRDSSYCRIRSLLYGDWRKCQKIYLGNEKCKNV